MLYKENWEETKTKWTNYWKHQNTGRPLMSVIARRPEVEGFVAAQEGQQEDVICQGNYYNLPESLHCKDTFDRYRNAERMVARYRWFCRTHAFLGESFPNLSVDFGPGSLAGYLGSEIRFRDDTVWFDPCIDDWEETPPFRFNPESKWFREHLELIKECRRLAENDFLVDIPDMMENMDVLASLRGTEEILYDLVDDPEILKERIDQIGDIYYEYFDRFYDAVRDQEGGNAYTIFQIWGRGKTVKLQCDLAAMLSPDNFRQFIQKSLRKQAQKADNVLYHLDGPDCIRHLDAIMEIDEIDALQWTSGDAGPDGTLEDWDIIYDKVVKAGKSLWVKVYSGDVDDWIRNTDRIVKKYGSHALYLMYPEMSMADAEKLLRYAEDNWRDVRGIF